MDSRRRHQDCRPRWALALCLHCAVCNSGTAMSMNRRLALAALRPQGNGRSPTLMAWQSDCDYQPVLRYREGIIFGKENPIWTDRATTDGPRKPSEKASGAQSFTPCKPLLPAHGTQISRSWDDGSPMGYLCRYSACYPPDATLFHRFTVFDLSSSFIHILPFFL